MAFVTKLASLGWNRKKLVVAGGKGARQREKIKMFSRREQIFFESLQFSVSRFTTNACKRLEKNRFEKMVFSFYSKIMIVFHVSFRLSCHRPLVFYGFSFCFKMPKRKKKVNLFFIRKRWHLYRWIVWCSGNLPKACFIMWLGFLSFAFASSLFVRIRNTFFNVY